MLIAGCVPIKSFKHRNQIVNKLKEEFGKGIRINFENGFVVYSYLDKSKLNK